MHKGAYVLSLLGAVAGAYLYLPLLEDAFAAPGEQGSLFVGLAVPIITYVFARSVEKLLAPK